MPIKFNPIDVSAIRTIWNIMRYRVLTCKHLPQPICGHEPTMKATFDESQTVRICMDASPVTARGRTWTHLP